MQGALEECWVPEEWQEVPAGTVRWCPQKEYSPVRVSAQTLRLAAAPVQRHVVRESLHNASST